MSPLNVAILGLGTVGSGVARILLEHPDRIARRAGRPVQLVTAVVRDLQQPRDVQLPAGTLTNDPQRAFADDVDVIIQLIGGIDPARELMQRAIASGKDVVTANKALLCEHGGDLFQLARQQGRCICFEAAVAGGVPVVAGIGQALSANQLSSIEAILNGTSNFILSEMLADRKPYSQVLKLSQDLGYAEADPTLDVDGTDAAQKLVILTQLAFGTRVGLDDFARQGIDMLDLADLLYAEELGYRVKLLAVAKLVDNHLEMHVQPTLVHADRPLARTSGPRNTIALQGDAVGKLWFSGPGAGQMPTASAVVADLIDVATGRAAATFQQLDLWHDQQPIPVLPAENIKHRYYLRFNVVDRPHVFADIAAILGKHDISLASIIQHEAPESVPEEHDEVVSVVVMTHRTSAGQLRAADNELDQLTSIVPPRIRMPVSN